MPKPRQPDRHVGLGSRDEPIESTGLGEWAGLRRDERDQALAESDNLGHQVRDERAVAMAATIRAARSRMPSGSASPISQLPMPTPIAPAAMNEAALSSVTPPVGSSGSSGNGPRHSRMNEGPTDEAGTTFIAAAPARQAARISVGVAQPGRAGTPRSAAQRTSSSSRWGMTRKAAPASTARSAASIDRTV